MAAARVVPLLERGLRHFALGELDHAVACWREVLAVDPTNQRAVEYLQLMEQTGVAAVAPEPAPAAQPSGDLLPWFEDLAPPPAETPGGPLLDDWFDQRLGTTSGAIPPVAPDSLPWREWVSEAGFHATGELPWDEEDVAQGPVSGAHPEPAPATQQAADPLLSTSWSEVIPHGAGQQAVDADTLEIALDEVDASWTPGPLSTGWDVGEAADGLLLPPDPAPDALELLVDEVAAPVAVPASLARQTTPGPDPRAEADTLMRGARELFELGDFSGSLELALKALALQPDHRDALDYLERNQETLVQMYESKLGPLSNRPRVALRPDEIVWLNLDHRAGFVLAQIDGTVTFDDLYALSGLARLDTAKILAELVEQGVITP